MWCGTNMATVTKGDRRCPAVHRPQRRRQGRGQLPQASPGANVGLLGLRGWQSGWVGEEGTGALGNMFGGRCTMCILPQGCIWGGAKEAHWLLLSQFAAATCYAPTFPFLLAVRPDPERFGQAGGGSGCSCRGSTAGACGASCSSCSQQRLIFWCEPAAGGATGGAAGGGSGGHGAAGGPSVRTPRRSTSADRSRGSHALLPESSRRYCCYRLRRRWPPSAASTWPAPTALAPARRASRTGAAAAATFCATAGRPAAVPTGRGIGSSAAGCSGGRRRGRARAELSASLAVRQCRQTEAGWETS